MPYRTGYALRDCMRDVEVKTCRKVGREKGKMGEENEEVSTETRS